MKVESTKAFDKQILKLRDNTIKKRLLGVIETIENVELIDDLPNVKAMVGFQGYYRIRIGDYRLGFSIEKKTVWLLYFGKRDENTYRDFP